MSLAGLIRECIEKSTAGTGIRCDVFIADDLYPLEEGKDEELRRVLTSLLEGALKVVPAGETVFVSAENVDIDSGSDLPPGPGRYVKISINDLAAVLPFEDTGTGWHISIEHEGTSGTTASLYVPASAGSVEKKEEWDFSDSVSCCSGKILIMDDEETIRELMRDFLEPFGHRVEFAGEGSEAVEKYREAMEQGEPFDVVLLDLTIQDGMDGRETIKRLRELDPSVRAIAASGFPDDPVMLDFRSHGFVCAIAKPCSMTELHNTLHNVMAGGKDR